MKYQEQLHLTSEERHYGVRASERKEAKRNRLTSDEVQAGIDLWLEDFNNEIEFYDYGLRGDL